MVFQCGIHCEAKLCMMHLKKHAAEIKFTHETIPQLVKGKA